MRKRLEITENSLMNTMTMPHDYASMNTAFLLKVSMEKNNDV
jgi:hypothetical protein